MDFLNINISLLESLYFFREGCISDQITILFGHNRKLVGRLPLLAGMLVQKKSGFQHQKAHAHGSLRRECFIFQMGQLSFLDIVSGEFWLDIVRWPTVICIPACCCGLTNLVEGPYRKIFYARLLWSVQRQFVGILSCGPTTLGQLLVYCVATFITKTMKTFLLPPVKTPQFQVRV